MARCVSKVLHQTAPNYIYVYGALRRHLMGYTSMELLRKWNKNYPPPAGKSTHTRYMYIQTANCRLRALNDATR